MCQGAERSFAAWTPTAAQCNAFESTRGGRGCLYARVAHALDGHAGRWVDMHTSACVGARARRAVRGCSTCACSASPSARRCGRQWTCSRSPTPRSSTRRVPPRRAAIARRLRQRRAPRARPPPATATQLVGSRGREARAQSNVGVAQAVAGPTSSSEAGARSAVRGGGADLAVDDPAASRRLAGRPGRGARRDARAERHDAAQPPRAVGRAFSSARGSAGPPRPRQRPATPRGGSRGFPSSIRGAG